MLIFMSLGSDKKKSTLGAAPQTKTAEYQRSVNRHLMMTNERINLEKRRAAIDAYDVENRFRAAEKQQNYAPSNRGLDLSTDQRVYEIANDLGRGEKQAQDPSTPSEVVQAELYAIEQSNEYNQAYREEYARQFVENARRGGYRVKLSEDLSRVISVTPIRNPSGNMGNYGGGATQ